MIKDTYQQKEKEASPTVIRQFEKAMMLRTLDQFWREHLSAMDYLRQGIHLRGFAQKNPKQEYKREAFELFVALLDRVNYETISCLTQFQIQKEEKMHPDVPMPSFDMTFQHPSFREDAEPPSSLESVQLMTTPKIGRNELCSCGSGKKYKHCHGKI